MPDGNMVSMYYTELQNKPGVRGTTLKAKAIAIMSGGGGGGGGVANSCPSMQRTGHLKSYKSLDGNSITIIGK